MHRQQVFNPFLDPQSTWAALEPWVRLAEGVPPSEAALDFLGDHDGGTIRDLTEERAAMLRQIVHGLAEVELQYAPYLAGGISVVEEEHLFTTETCRVNSDNGIIRIFSEQFGCEKSSIAAEFLKPLGSDASDLQGRQDEVRSRRKMAIIQRITPELKGRGTKAAVQTGLPVGFPDANPEELQLFLKPMHDNNFQATLESLLGTVRSALAGSVDEVQFFPLATAEYTFVNHGGKGWLSVDQQLVKFCGGDLVLATRPTSLTQGRRIVLRFNGELFLKGVTYSTLDSEGAFDETSAVPSPAYPTIPNSMSRIERAPAIAKTLNLSPAETEFHYRRLNLFDLKVDQMQTLLAFVRARTQLGVSSPSFAGHCQYLERSSRLADPNDPADPLKEELALAQLAAETHQIIKLTAENLSALFDLQWPAMSAWKRATALLAQGLASLRRLANCYGAGDADITHRPGHWQRSALCAALTPRPGEGIRRPHHRHQSTAMELDEQVHFMAGKPEGLSLPRKLGRAVVARRQDAGLRRAGEQDVADEPHQASFSESMFMPSTTCPTLRFRATYGRRSVDSVATTISLPEHAPRPSTSTTEEMEVDILTHEVDGVHNALERTGCYILPALFRNRLFLFLPQITPLTRPANLPSGSMMAAAQDEYGPKTPEQGREVKMAWVEMRNGKWSPKYVTANGMNSEELHKRVGDYAVGIDPQLGPQVAARGPGP
ncbi:hypothetical protein V494_00011 [Pseudogymnoascus sp. VKM F-4513 (FW-928)]|nr:hypothetical protein V494_00011 [Pseudogymnoascus sp. VKM F-4513 (FW-928)]